MERVRVSRAQVRPLHVSLVFSKMYLFPAFSDQVWSLCVLGRVDFFLVFTFDVLDTISLA